MKRINQAIANARRFINNQPLSVRYGIDGVLTLGAFSLVANNNNLFAQRLGAGDFHLSMLQFLPQMMNLFLLIPAGLIIDSMGNKRRMLSWALIVAGVLFAVAGGTAFIPVYTIYFFLVFLSLATVSSAVTNLSWQAYFPEVVTEEGSDTKAGKVESRNAVLTFRARMTMIVSLVVPLAVGVILTSIPSHEGKIAAHQAFYVLAAVMLVYNAFHFKKINAVLPAIPKKVAFTEIKESARRLTKNKPFIYFTLTILFFHMTWQADWTLYFIGQANYLGMNELLLSLAPVGAVIAQLSTLKYWSRNNARHGVEMPMVFGILGLALCPLAMIVGLSLPHPFGIIVFLIIHTIAHLSFATLTLNLFQCLLKVVDKQNRSFSISIYTILITLSNAVMPVAGVALYRALGGDRTAIVNTFIILFFLRIVAAGAWFLRVKVSMRTVLSKPV